MMTDKMVNKNKFKSAIPEIWSDISGYPENVISLHRFLWILRFYGVPIPTEYIKGFIKILYTIFAIFSMAIIVTFYVSLQLIDAYYVTVSADLEDIVHNYVLTFNYTIAIFKVVNFLWHWNTISGMVNIINECTQKYADTEHHMKKLNTIVNSVNNVYYLFVSSSWFALATGYHMIITDPTTLGKRLLFRAYIPEFLPNILIYPMFIVCVFWIGQVIMAHDCFVMELLNQIVGQLMMLDYNLRNLIANKRSADKVSEIEKLKSYIKHHQIILKLHSDVQSIFSKILLMQFLSSLLMFGLLGFLVSYKHNFTSSQLSIYMYAACIFIELFIYCYFANEIIVQSNAITISAYSCSWYEFDNKFTVLLLIFMSKSQINLRLSVSGFFVLSLDTFTYVLTRSYSCIAILRRFYYGK